MKRSQEFLFLSSLLIVSFLSALFPLVSHLALPESSYNFLGKTKKITLAPGSPVTQTFTTQDNNLNQIRFIINNLHLQKNDSLINRLLDSECKNEIRKKIFTQTPPEQSAYSIFSFEPISDSQGKQFCFEVTFQTKSEKRSGWPTLSATTEPSKVFSDRQLTDTNKGEVYSQQTLFLRPAYTSDSILGNLWKLTERLSQYKPAMFKGWGLIFLVGTFVLGTIIFIMGTSVYFKKEE